MPHRPLLELSDISLNYGAVQALRHLNLTFYESEIHAIVGEHGAGKSSIGLIMSGLLKPMRGTLVVRGTSYDGLSIKQARKLGIEMVAQQNYLLDDLSIADNLCINMPDIRRKFLVDETDFVRNAGAYLRQHDIDLQPEELLRNLPLPDRVLVDILKHLYVHPDVLILDEALEKLTAASLNKVLPLLHQLKRAGSAIVFVTHRIDDIYDYADRVSIIRKGELLMTDSTRNIDKINLIKLAYTQLPRESRFSNVNAEFYQLLKYNQAILEELPVNLIVTDTEHNIKLFNEQAIRYFEVEREACYNLPIESLFRDQQTEFLRALTAGLDAHKGHVLYNQPLTIHGTVKVGNITMTPIFDGKFKIGTLLMVEDITEQQQLREQIMFSEKLASVGLLAAGVAHEVNNPLEILENCLDFLNLELSDPEQRKALRDIEEVKDSIAHIVSNLRSFSPQQSSPTERFDLNALIVTIIHLIKHYSKHRGTDILVQTHGELYVEGNKNDLKQVIINLIKNGFEAMPNGGTITIATRLLITPQAARAEISVNDTGDGIAAENPNDIFLPFYSTKTKGGHNLGLGLYMSYTLIQKNHGDMRVENLEQGGCRFTISLPAAGPASG